MSIPSRQIGWSQESNLLWGIWNDLSKVSRAVNCCTTGTSTNQGSPSINILKEALFANQLERDGLTGTPYEIVIEMAVQTTSGGEGAFASIDWEEISR